VNRSPIQRMVDEACGFDPDAPAPPKEPVQPPTDEEVRIFTECMDAAMKWSRKPSDPKRVAALRKACRAAREAGWR
jgi:hypothetical protein